MSRSIRSALRVVTHNVVFFAFVLGLVIPAAASAMTVPILKPDAGTPNIDPSRFASLLVIDTRSGKTLYKLNPEKSWTPASLTKLMTAATFASTPTKWDSAGLILSSDEVGGGRLAVSSGARMTLRDLLNAALVGSANNAAEALGRIDGPGRASFVKKVNTYAQTLGLTNSVFHDASGMNETNRTTAYDLALIFQKGREDAEIKKAMTTSNYQFTIATRGKTISHTIKNTNTLLFGNPDITVTGGKTGYLVESRYNFALAASPGIGEPQNAGEVAVFVLGAPTRDDSQRAGAELARWAWNAFDWDAASSTPATFTRTLASGDKGTDVKAMQKYLNTHGAVITTSGPGSPGKETELFGAMTKTALAKFQTMHAAEILKPQGRASATGAFDIGTRAYFNEHP
jgi:D-alanyl-D-alanine endopeptidase (penicillin-binding protein 7)